MSILIDSNKNLYSQNILKCFLQNLKNNLEMKWIILSLVLLLNKGVFTKKHHTHIYYRQSIKKQQNQHTNISKLLDKLLENYDNSLRPNLLGPPVVVEIDLMVRSMSQISEVEMVSKCIKVNLHIFFVTHNDPPQKLLTNKRKT